VFGEEGELNVEYGDTVDIVARDLVLTGNITVKDNSRLFFGGSRVQLSVRGEKTYNVSTLDTGEMVMRDSAINTLSRLSIIKLRDRSSITMINSNITGFIGLYSQNNSVLTVEGGRLGVGYIECLGEAASITGSYMPKGLLYINATEALVERFNGDRVSIDVTRSTLGDLVCNQLTVKSDQPIYLNKSRIKSCNLQSGGEIIVTDSTFNSLFFSSSGVAVNAVTSINKGARAGGPIYAAQNATVMRYWYLTVKVTDLSDVGIPAAITLTDHLNNTVSMGKANVEGVYSKPVLAEVINGSRVVFEGNYRVKAEYLDYATNSVPLVLDGNKEVQLKFRDYVPLETTTTLTVSPTEVYVGESVNIRGWINSGQPGEFIEIITIDPSDNRKELAYRTVEEGVFEGELEMQAAGQWVIYADWIGGPSHEMSTRSQAFVVMAKARPSIMDLLIRALPIVVLVIGVLASMSFLALRRMKGPKI
jgi:hypothetical protein